MSGFNDAVKGWLQSRGYPVEDILSVQGNGTDWAGGTEDGFHSTFDARTKLKVAVGVAIGAVERPAAPTDPRPKSRIITLTQ